jgi:hypothetical protein
VPGQRHGLNEEHMTTTKKRADVDMLPEYDFSKAVRGKYYARFKQSSNVVVLDDDVARLFPNAEAVNGALRTLATVAKRARSGGTTSILVQRPDKQMQRKRPAQAKKPARAKKPHR